MGIIKVINAVHEYFRRNQNGDVVEEVCALDDVSLEIEEGEFISILGHNGKVLGVNSCYRIRLKVLLLKDIA